jgi:hypothetical protein
LHGLYSADGPPRRRRADGADHRQHPVV